VATCFPIKDFMAGFCDCHSPCCAVTARSVEFAVCCTPKGIFELNPTRLVFHYLQTNERQETARDAKQLEEAQETVQEAAAEIRAREFPPKPGFICRNCAFRPIYPAHEEHLSN
jgi:hypothetical protein